MRTGVSALLMGVLAIVADPVAPQTRQVRLEAFAESPRIAGTGGALVEVGDDLALSRFAKLAELLERPFIGPISPAHASLPRRRVGRGLRIEPLPGF